MRSVRVVAVAALVAVSLAACGSSSKSSSTAATTSKRPSTQAKLQILQPTPNQVTGPNLTVKVNLIGATIVPSTNVGPPKNGTEGHIHVSVDGKIVQMAYQAEQAIGPLDPGQHNLTAEFVATDHQPFANRVIAAVLFTVQGTTSTT
ncbi:MAG: hypothetical protein JO367_04850 [Actinobacteria bacterium]|nr:hypothetical protein [Actinomycetota bacterium]MBV9933609.1 hypothetical protein [Actinomycetota bacterium]